MKTTLKTEYHNNGQKMEGKKPYKDGKKDGIEIKWYENGQKKEEVTWKGGRRTGLWTWWE
jgi:hypothetical protein